MLDSHLYLYVKAGSSLKPGSLVPQYGVRAHYVSLPNGDAVGVFFARGAKARMILQATNGITLLPPLSQTISAEHVTAFGYAGAKAGDTGHDVALALFQYHRMPWFHPEEPYDSTASVADLFGG